MRPRRRYHWFALSGTSARARSCGTVARRRAQPLLLSRDRSVVIGPSRSAHCECSRFRCDAVLCGRQSSPGASPTAGWRHRHRRTARSGWHRSPPWLALGGRPTANFAERLMLPVSKDTLLRVVRRRTHLPSNSPRVVGIDAGLGGGTSDTAASSAIGKTTGSQASVGPGAGDRAGSVRWSPND